MNDHLVDGGNLRDVLYAVMLVGFLALLTWSVSGCTPQQSAQLYPMIGMGTSITSQAESLWQMQQQAQFQKQQQELQLEQMRANQR
jgi:NADH:ubiquinone oxidoreductase subunit B-like Fe-S oxidoreductase